MVDTIKKTGFDVNTANNFVVNAGAVYQNLKWTEGSGWTGTRLGATSGGNSVTISNEFRDIEIDGTFSKYIGQKVLVSSDATLTANVKEITANAIKLAILGKSEVSSGEDAPADYDVITGKSKIEASDYLTNIALVGEMSGTNDPIIIILDNALCTSGLELSTTDDNEAVVTMTFEAHADANQVADRTLPARIYLPVQTPTV